MKAAKLFFGKSSLVAGSGMTNKWLKEQGLISVKEQWVKIHYPTTARNSVNRPVRARMPGGGVLGIRDPRLPDW